MTDLNYETLDDDSQYIPVVISQPVSSYPPGRSAGVQSDQPHLTAPGSNISYPPDYNMLQNPFENIPLDFSQDPLAQPQLLQVHLDTSPELALLDTVDQLVVKQTQESFEAFAGFERNQKYKILNSRGQRMFIAKEDTPCPTTNCCCGSIRPFNITICDNSGSVSLQLTRPLACQSCFFPCCLQKLEIQSPPGTRIGSIEQDWTLLSTSFTVKDMFGVEIFQIRGPCRTSTLLGCCCRDGEFNVYYARDQRREIGRIRKNWPGFEKETPGDVDNLGIYFPLDLPAKMKATLLGAMFLIDIMLFQTKT